MHMWGICFSLPSNFCLWEFDGESRHQSRYVFSFSFLFFFTRTVRGFIKHQRLENSPSATHNSPAKFQ